MSLFQFCNATQTQGGEKALQRRMKQPWAKAEQIHATHTAINFIISQPNLFKKFDESNLGFVAGSIDAYLYAALPLIVYENTIEFAYSAAALYASDAYHISMISRNVNLMRKLLHSMREFLGQPELQSAVGEIAPLITEAKAIVFEGKLAAIQQEQPGMGLRKLWRILRQDQLFRIQAREEVARLLALIYEMDALISLAKTTKNNNLKLPMVEEGDLHIYAEGLKHPYLQNAVANSVQLNQEKCGLFLTGPNMAGKTTYMRAFAIALYLAHLGMGLPASVYRFTPVQEFVSSISLSDNLHAGVSYFRAEALRVKDVANAIKSGARVVAIMDEPFKGTNVKDTLEASMAILSRFSAMPNLLFMFSSHQIELADKIQGAIDFRYFSAIETEERLRFDYTLREGVATQRIGMRVLKEEGVFDVLDTD